MSLDTKHEELKRLRIDSSLRAGGGSARWWGVVLAAVVAAGAVVLVLVRSVPVPLVTFGSSAVEVQVVRARAESDVSSIGGETVLSAAGYIVARHKIDVNSKVTGRLAWIGVEKGDKVRAGQLLARLEDDEFRAQVEQARGAVASMEARLKELRSGSRPEEIQQATSNLEEAKVTLANSKRALERTKQLVEQGVVALQELDDARARYDVSLHRVQALEQALILARKGPRSEEIERAEGNLAEARGKLAYAESQLASTRILAPISGTILERTAEKGELVTAQFASAADAGGPRGSVVALADLTDLQVELDISQNDFSKLGPSQRAAVTLEAYPGREYRGYINEVSPEANRQKATVQVKVKIEEPDEFMRPDMNANVRFLADANSAPARDAAGIKLPAGALRDRGGRKVVLLAYDGRAVEREVKVVGRSGDGYVVEGLAGGEDVIVNSPDSLKDGDRIAVKQ